MIAYNMEKRINAMVKDHGHIDYMFRDFDNALLTYRKLAVKLLDSTLDSIEKVRKKLKERGATIEQIYIFDSKVKKCFNKSVNIIRNRVDNPECEHIEEDSAILYEILRLNIDDYYNENRWICE